MNGLRPRLWWGALTGFYRPGVADVPSPDRVALFLYSARSVILVISVQAALIAGLMAADVGLFDWACFMGVLAGFVVAHMISNLSNDYFGFVRGHDKPESPRMRYTVHPLASAVLDRRALIAGLAGLAVIGLGITAYFIALRGWDAVAFAAAGILLLFWYDAAPTPLKSLGLGELAVLLVWGPLMIGGGFSMIAGHVSGAVMLASLPYGLSVMSILVGKHIDQRDFDSREGLNTLPVLIGEGAARALNVAAIVAIYGIVGLLIAVGWLTPFAALTALALPRALKAVRIMRAPRPDAPPPGYIGWPLWYHRACLAHARVFGRAFIGGLAASVAWRAVMSFAHG